MKLLRGGEAPAQSLVGVNAVNWNSGNKSMTGPQFADAIRAKFLGAAGGPQSPQTTPASAAYAQPTAVPASATASGAPVYSSDIGTTFRQLGNTAAPGWVEAATPLTAEQAAAQKVSDAATANQYGGVASGLAALASLFGQQRQSARPEQPTFSNEVVRGQFRPIQGTRGLL